jgi:hypothetical protein
MIRRLDEVKARLMTTATKFTPGFSAATDPTTGITYIDEYDTADFNAHSSQSSQFHYSGRIE